MKKKYIIIIIVVLLLITLGISIYFKTAFLSKNEIKNIIIKDTNLTNNDIYFDSIDLDIKDNKYEIDFYYNNKEYEYKIDAKNGRIIYNNFKVNNSTKNNSSQNNSSNNSNQNNVNNTEITLEEAKNIALSNANANQNSVTFIETKTDLDDGQKIYDIEFIYNNQEFNYEISATTSEIISYDRDNIR